MGAINKNTGKSISELNKLIPGFNELRYFDKVVERNKLRYETNGLFIIKNIKYDLTDRIKYIEEQRFNEILVLFLHSKCTKKESIYMRSVFKAIESQKAIIIK